jgi:hypothetical protein
MGISTREDEEHEGLDLAENGERGWCIQLEISEQNKSDTSQSQSNCG